MTRSLRDALGEAMRSAALPLAAKDIPWTEAGARQRSLWLLEADDLLAIATSLGITITMGGEPENTER